MRGNANCSEMVMILLTIILYVSRFSGRTVYYEIYSSGQKSSRFRCVQCRFVSVYFFRCVNCVPLRTAKGGQMFNTSL